MPTTPTQTGTLLKTVAAPTTPKVLIAASTYRYTGKDFRKVVEVEDNTGNTANITFQNPFEVMEFEGTTITGQTAPVQGELVTFTFPDATTTELVCREPVPLEGFGEVQRARYKFEKPVNTDLSPA